MHRLHSPYLFKLFSQASKNKLKPNIIQINENAKKRFQIEENIEFKPIGANKSEKNEKTTLNSLYKRVATPERYRSLLYTLAREREGGCAIEFGTSLGIGSAAIALGLGPNGHLTTMDGLEILAPKANALWEDLSLENIKLITADFDTVLPTLPIPSSGWNLAYIDGNHTYEATLRYTEYALRHGASDLVVVVDDIYWSSGMTKAWNTLKQHKEVTFAVDLYRMGLLFTDNRFLNQHDIKLWY